VDYALALAKSKLNKAFVAVGNPFLRIPIFEAGQ
jgi:hypothetical protein